MTARKLMLCAATFVSVFSLSFASQPASAEEAARKAAPSAGKAGPSERKEAPSAEASGDSPTAGAPMPVRKKSSGKAKRGEVCKVDEDCAGEMICGKGKCEYNLSQAHPAT